MRERTSKDDSDLGELTRSTLFQRQRGRQDTVVDTGADPSDDLQQWGEGAAGSVPAPRTGSAVTRTASEAVLSGPLGGKNAPPKATIGVGASAGALHSPHLSHLSPKKSGHTRVDSMQEIPDHLSDGPTAAFLQRSGDAAEEGTRHWLKKTAISPVVPRKLTHARTQVVHQEEAISEETLQKAESAKHFLGTYWRSLMQYLEQRRVRVEDFKRRMEDMQRESPGEYTAVKIERDYVIPFFNRETQRLHDRRVRPRLKEYETLVRIGKGGFAEVFLARHVRERNVVAVKRMVKDHIRSTNKLEHVRTERDVMAKANEMRCPWIPQLLASFQDSVYLFLVMEFLPGGDFRTLISNLGFLPESDARFYMAEMITAVGYLHRMGFVHR
jgi:Protein kinase domain